MPFVPVDGPARLYQLVARGDIGRAGDVDFYLIGRLQSGDVLTITLSGAPSSRGSLEDSYLELFRAGANRTTPLQVAQNDDGGPGRDSYLYRFRVSIEDEYFVRCRARNVPRTGTYDLSVWLEDDPRTAAPATAAAQAVAGTPVESEPNDTADDAEDRAAAWSAVEQVSKNEGVITGTGELAVDEYLLDLRAGDTVSVVVDSTSILDAAVTLIDPDGGVMASDGDSDPGNFGDARDAVLYGCQAAVTGTFHMSIRGTIGTTGSYGAFVYLSPAPQRPPASVVGRYVFYNNSVFDTHSAGPTAADDSAIATDKVALGPDGSATPDNITSYVRGMNGVMIDVAGLRGDLQGADFLFEMSLPEAPGAWMEAPAPASITRRAGAGTGGSDRVTLVWPDGAIIDRWLRLTLRASKQSGLAADDIFAFGNLIGYSGDGASPAIIGPAEILRTRSRQGTHADVTELCDFNRDGHVNAIDTAIARSHVGHELPLLTPAAGEAPDGSAGQFMTPPARLSRVPIRRAWYEPDVGLDGM